MQKRKKDKKSKIKDPIALKAFFGFFSIDYSIIG